MNVVPVRSVASISRVTIGPSTMDDTVDLFSIPALDATGTPETVRSNTIDSGKLLLSGGEVLISKLNPRKPRVHLVDDNLARQSVSSPEFVALRPNAATDPRYLSYALLSERTRQDLDAEVRSATRSHQRVEPSTILSIRIAAPSSGDQRRIADFLDDQVARIDAMITARRRQLTLGEAMLNAALADLMTSYRRTVPMRRLLDEAVVGIVVRPADLYVDVAGVPSLRGTDVKERTVANSGHAAISIEGHAANPRSALRTGDLVVVRTGDAGWASVVPEWASGWNCIDLVVLRASPGVDAHFLELAINASKRAGSVGNLSAGALHQHFGVGALRDLQVPDITEAQRGSLIEQSDVEYLKAHAFAAKVAASVALLIEYKQSLITAAVSGELDVTTAARVSS